MKFGRLKKIIFGVLIVLGLSCCGGCAGIGFLLSPSPYERKVPPAFDLSPYNKEKILVVVRSAQTAGVDADVPKKTADALEQELIRKVKFEDENVFNEFDLADRGSFQYGTWSEIENDARRTGAKLLLYTEIIGYEMINLRRKDYYAGGMTIRSVLLNTETGELLWPQSEPSRIITVEAKLETKGREQILLRLASAAAHCAVREFYPCPEPDYRIQEEVRPVQNIMNDFEK